MCVSVYFLGSTFRHLSACTCCTCIPLYLSVRERVRRVGVEKRRTSSSVEDEVTTDKIVSVVCGVAVGRGRGRGRFLTVYINIE
jgi:hypothetical protein